MEANSNQEKFWTDDPCILLHVNSPCKIIPNKTMSKDEKLNSITRLVILISLGLYLMDYQHWSLFLLSGLVLLIFVRSYLDRKDSKNEKEGFTVVPTYQGLNLQQTTVAPLFSEEWQMYPPAYDLYTNVPPPCTFQEPLTPQSYPYGQYLTRTNLLPSDEYATHMLNGGTKNAREYANSAFLRHDLAFRDNMTRLYKKQIDRRFRQNCSDTFSPYTSY